MRNMMITTVISILLSTLTISCSKPISHSIQQDRNPIILLTKEKCRGYCPAFTLEIYESGKVKYTGAANVKIIGEELYEIQKEELNGLLATFEESNYKTFKNEYLTHFMDIPKITLKYKDHEIIYHERIAPEALKELSKQVERFLPQ